MKYFETDKLSVGYKGRALIHDIDISMDKGSIMTLIGPNGAGKSTILKTITRHLAKIGGAVFIGEKDVHGFSAKEMAGRVAVVLTERIRPELMTCREVVAMGRYPYTNVLGRLTPKDSEAVDEALKRVHAASLADRDFATLSDGQRQRIMLARAICQEPEVIVLDEPTAYLDIRFKIELLEILRDMAQEKEITVIMSLHEIDLAAKISDYLICVKGDIIAAFGSPEEILKEDTIDRLYEIENGSYNRLYGSVELASPKGEPKVFVVGGAGYGVECYRMLQKRQIPFAAGILYENDLDYPVAAALSEYVVTAAAFEPMTEEQFDRAAELLRTVEAVIDAGTPVKVFNRMNESLLERAADLELPVYKSVGEWLKAQENVMGNCSRER